MMEILSDNTLASRLLIEKESQLVNKLKWLPKVTTSGNFSCNKIGKYITADTIKNVQLTQSYKRNEFVA